MSAALLNALSSITGTGKFHSTGSTTFFLPMLEVEGVGEIAFPLPASQAKQLAAVAESAPYGKGERTVHDSAVRKCFQIDATQFAIRSPQWDKYLRQTLDQIRADMGIHGEISAHPYKLLIYPKGGHFKPHRDTEKLDAMFGTLIIALPSAHEGGQLLIRHNGRGIEIDFSHPDHRHDFQHAAFFADCEHEVVPVRSGFRVCLVYNLRLDKGDPSALNLPLDEHARKLLPVLGSLKNEMRSELRAVLLDHSYSEANFSLRNLKGDDATRARALLAAAADSGLTAHLALVELYQMGELTEDTRRTRRYSRYHDDFDYDPEDGAMGEIYEESLTIDHWRTASDYPVALGCYRIKPENLLAKNKLDQGDPDEKEAEGYTGNAGCTMEYWYRRAAIVLWASEDDETILCEKNLEGACSRFDSLAAQTKTGPGTPFHRLGEAILTHLPEYFSQRHRYGGGGESDSPFVRILKAIARAKHRDLLNRLIHEVPENAWEQCQADLWKQLDDTFGYDAFTPVEKRLLTDPTENRTALFLRLEDLLTRKEAAESAARIAAALARLPAPDHKELPAWGVDKNSQHARRQLRLILGADHLPNMKSERKHSAAFVFGDASLDQIRRLLGPVLCSKPIARIADKPGTLAFLAREVAINILGAEILRPIHPYPDWRRPYPEEKPAHRSNQPWQRYGDTGAEQSQAFRELREFMADPERQKESFRYRQDIRSDLENFIKNQHLDLDCTTLRQGTPHSLVCTKNNNSHKRKLGQRAEDEELLGKIQSA